MSHRNNKCIPNTTLGLDKGPVGPRYKFDNNIVLSGGVFMRFLLTWRRPNGHLITLINQTFAQFQQRNKELLLFLLSC